MGDLFNDTLLAVQEVAVTAMNAGRALGIREGMMRAADICEAKDKRLADEIREATKEKS